MEPSEPIDKYKFEFLKAKRNRKYQSATFIEIINIDDLDPIIDEYRPPYDALRQCLDDPKCSVDELQMFKVPLEYYDRYGNWYYRLDETVKGIVVRRKCDGTLIPVEGKHRLRLAKERNIKHVIARVQYSYPCEHR